MEISIDQLLSGKATQIKNKEYYETARYVEPFLEKMSKLTDNFIINVKLADQVTKTKDGNLSTTDITYNRVWIQAVLPDEYNVANHSEVLGFLYGIDVRKPVVKFYRGNINNACTNLCVFNPSHLKVSPFEAESALDYKPVDYLINQASEIRDFLNKLNNTYFSYSDEMIEKLLGHWIRRSINDSYNVGYGAVKIAADTPINVYKMLIEDPESPYYIPRGEDISMFKVYNAFTELITHDKDKDIINKPEKTLLLKNILSI